MNRIMNYVSHYFGTKDLSHYPELYRKTHHDLGYSIALSNSVVFHDVADTPRSLNWKAF